MKAHSFHCKSSQALKGLLVDHGEHHFHPSLALVFCSRKQDIDEIRSIFTALGIDVVGCTTAGEIVDDCLYETSIAVMLLSLDRAYYKVLFETYEGEDVGRAAIRLGKQAIATFPHQNGIILSSGFDSRTLLSNSI